MSNIKYIEDDLFTAKGFLGHACNCQGVWGSGVAKQFKERFFTEYLIYNAYSRLLYSHSEPEIGIFDEDSQALGTTFIVNRIVCLFTSLNYGDKVDAPEKILENTKNALTDLNLFGVVKELNIPKINSGLFKVPWEETEKILLQFPEIQFNVYTGKN